MIYYLLDSLCSIAHQGCFVIPSLHVLTGQAALVMKNAYIWDKLSSGISFRRTDPFLVTYSLFAPPIENTKRQFEQISEILRRLTNQSPQQNLK